VFATDALLTTLMCVKSSKYSWDVIVTKQDGQVFLDWRPESNLTLLTVNETAPEEVCVCVCVMRCACIVLVRRGRGGAGGGQ
jgi:hypothetical protein